MKRIVVITDGKVLPSDIKAELNKKGYTDVIIDPKDVTKLAPEAAIIVTNATEVKDVVPTHAAGAAVSPSLPSVSEVPAKEGAAIAVPPKVEAPPAEAKKLPTMEEAKTRVGEAAIGSVGRPTVEERKKAHADERDTIIKKGWDFG